MEEAVQLEDVGVIAERLKLDLFDDLFLHFVLLDGVLTYFFDGY